MSSRMRKVFFRTFVDFLQDNHPELICYLNPFGGNASIDKYIDSLPVVYFDINQSPIGFVLDTGS